MAKTLIIAEAGVNHNAELDLAYKLIDVAVSAGVDAVKFQVKDVEEAHRRGVRRSVLVQRGDEGDRARGDEAAARLLGSLRDGGDEEARAL